MRTESYVKFVLSTRRKALIVAGGFRRWATKTRYELEQTPEGRLAVIAHNLTEEFAQNYQETRIGPQRPDLADFRKVFGLYVQREILEAELGILERYGTFVQAIEKYNKLNEIAFKIAQREHPPET